MISHEVIVTPEAQVYTRSPVSNGEPFPNIKSQADLDKYWAESPFAIGDFVTYSPQNFFTANSIASVYQIMDTVTDFTVMQTRNHIPYHPVLVRLQSLPQPTGSQWDRWDDLRNLRKLNELEIETTVRPHLDRVRGNSQSQT
jgi:hypothetical protein